MAKALHLLVVLSFLTVIGIITAQTGSPAAQSPRSVHIQGCDNPHNPECTEPPRPQCKIIINNEFRYEVKAPKYTQSVQPALQQLITTHQSSYPTYSLPLSFLWDLTGLNSFLESPNTNCCDKNIVFERNKVNRYRASFLWKGQAQILHSKPDPALGNFSLTLKFPSELAGQVAMAGGFSEFVFDGAARPHLTITDSGANIFDADIDCFNVSTSSTTIRRPFPSGNSQSNANILVLPN